MWKHRQLIEESDIVHCHDVFFWYLPLRFLYPTKKVFTTFHGWEGVFPPTYKAKWVRKLSEKLSWGNICVGDYIKKWYGTKADYVIYGGTSSPRRSPAESAGHRRGVFGFRGEVTKILFVGRLDEDTGLRTYLKALETLKTRNINFKIVFAGDGKLRNEAEKYGNVLGFVKDVERLIPDYRIIFTSGYLSILEAMVSKRLIVATYENPLKEDYLKMSPFSNWIIIEKEPLKISERIEYYLKHPREEKKLVEQAYEWAKEQTWEKTTQIYLNLWGNPEV